MLNTGELDVGFLLMVACAFLMGLAGTLAATLH